MCIRYYFFRITSERSEDTIRMEGVVFVNNVKKIVFSQKQQISNKVIEFYKNIILVTYFLFNSGFLQQHEYNKNHTQSTAFFFMDRLLFFKIISLCYRTKKCI